MIRSLRHLLAAAVWRLHRRIVLGATVADPWVPVDYQPAFRLYGSGITADFTDYLDGASAVKVQSVKGITSWLLNCEYATDQELFGERDFWQHPTTFEQRRRGDCEDFALWAWRKLLELQLEAEFVVGYWLPQMHARHAWVTFRDGGIRYLLEPTHRDPERMLRPLEEVKHEYVPEFGAKMGGKRFAYAGYLLAQRYRLRGAKSVAHTA